MIAETESPGRRSSTERFKNFIGRHVFHPFLGMTLGDWWAFLRRHRFAIERPVSDVPGCPRE
jgi:hypothetical protein